MTSCYSEARKEPNFGTPCTVFSGNCHGTPHCSNEQWQENLGGKVRNGWIHYNASNSLTVYFWCHDRDERLEFLSRCNRALKAIETEYREAYEEEQERKKEEKAKAARERGE